MGIPLPKFFKKGTSETLEKTPKKEYNKPFLAAIQPQGGVSFADKYIKKGDGYEAVLHIYEYPTEADPMWLYPIMTMKNVIVTIDIGTMEKDEAVTNINKSMLEQETRYNSEKKNSAQQDAENSYKELKTLYQEISRMGEVIKLIDIKLYIHSPTALELEEEVKNVIHELRSSGFKGQIFLNETEWEWQSLFMSYDQQQKLPNKRDGKGIPSYTLAGGMPFHFSDLNDPCGSYLGTTFSGGNVLFDLWHKDKRRKFYNAVLVGKMGMGKSTTLKKLMFDNASRGNFIRSFDVTGEFETLVESLNGYTLALDGSQGIINPLQIYKTFGESDFQKNEELSFMQHLAKMATFYQFVAKNPPTEEVEEFKKLLRTFYEKLGFKNLLKTTGVTTLRNDQYPILEDLLSFNKEELYEDLNTKVIRPELSAARIKRLEKIELVLDNLVYTYGRIFNGHTTLPDVTTEQVISFSIKNLRRMEKSIFQAQMFIAMTLIWDHMIQNGVPQLKAIYENDDLDLDDIIRLLVIIDESHLIINSDNLIGVDFLIEFAREARKYFGGLVFATQNIRDLVSDHTNSEAVTKIKTLFELTQYKFILQQDSNALDTLRKVFEGSISESELMQIPQFQEGNCLLAISGSDNLTMSIEASEEELALFRGGI